MQALEGYDWPGNVRELQNALERAVVVASGDRITPEDLPRRLLAPRDPVVPVAVHATAGTSGAEPTGAMIDIERRAILDALERSRHNISEACRILGIPRTTMYRKLRRHKIPMARTTG